MSDGLVRGEWRPRLGEFDMFRNILGLAAGAAVALAGVYAWQLLGHFIFPFGTMDPRDPGKREMLAHMSFAAQAWVVGGYAVGVAVGGLLGNRIADARWPAVLIALMVAGAFFATLTMAPHPFWIQAAGLALPIVTGVVVAVTVGQGTFRDRNRV